MLELRLAGNGEVIKNYKKSDTPFLNDLVEINFQIDSDNLLYVASIELNEETKTVVEEYLSLLRDDILKKWLYFKEKVHLEGTEYHGEAAVCTAATKAYLSKTNENPITVFNYLMGLLQDKMCFSCIRMHEYYKNCIEE